MAHHRRAPKWRTALDRILGRRTETPTTEVDPGTQLLPVLADPPTLPLPVYDWQTPDEWAAQHSGKAVQP